MKSTGAYIGLLIASSIFIGFFLPWWVLMLVSFGLAFYFKPSELKAFAIAFAATNTEARDVTNNIFFILSSPKNKLTTESYY